ncbi:acyltransferase [Bradyrhizobium sp. BRP22]|uniref:acyltransferase family protein n=1 Tax=Bradyrhizobium sp. BRP22 TaxID=2793821 RepID=UPI001CD57BEE|nr:acyltransferase family protein [Bradyrhizobium sp. BRP22]MCA1456305.1 acyltransferase [Bradyrhizobium sp. BRP22]
MKYRPDIDGLRALAVIPVVLYHVGVPGFAGGFVGVDIFFVISGYLICGMTDADIRNGSFSLSNFYKRRILRILPALVVMLLATSVLAYFYFLPVELEDFARSLAAAVGSVSNVYFAQTTGYFEAPAETKPLLHTWSLGVEEQSYLVVPIVMVIAYRFVPKRAKLLFAVAAALSLVAAIAISYRNEAFVFYLTPFRAWELALGALLAIGFVPAPRSMLWRNLCGAAGLILLFGVTVFGSSSAPLLLMTSLAAVGATLVIASSERGVSMVGRLLSLRPFVFVGLISYSLYLWHWPLIVFQHTDAILALGSPATVKLTLVILSLGMAYLSWKLIELPFRSLAHETSKFTVFATASTAMASILALCGLVMVAGGAPFRFPDRVVQIGSYLAYDSAYAFRTGRCFLLTNHQQFDAETCIKRDPERQNYLLVGDSYAAHLWYGLSAALPDVNVMQATASLCRPAAKGGSRYDTPMCRRLRDFIFNDFLAHNKVDKVLLAASWKDEDLPVLEGTLDILKARGLEVTVFGPVVEYDSALPRLLADEILHDHPAAASHMKRAGVRERDGAMSRLVAAHGATYVSLYDVMCHEGRCDEVVEGGVPIQFDGGHLTMRSIEVGKRIAPLFSRKLARTANGSN